MYKKIFGTTVPNNIVYSSFTFSKHLGGTFIFLNVVWFYFHLTVSFTRNIEGKRSYQEDQNATFSQAFFGTPLTKRAAKVYHATFYQSCLFSR